MVSQTIYVTDQIYAYALRTKGDDQSTNQRLAELIEKGKEFEQEVKE